MQGGLRGAPKFPNAPIFRFLLQMTQRLERLDCAGAVHLLLRRMSQNMRVAAPSAPIDRAGRSRSGHIAAPSSTSPPLPRK